MSSGNQRYINTAGSHDITMNDDYINVSTSVGAITLVFPNIRDSGAIPTNKVWFVNDVDDMAATNNVTIVASTTTPATELNGGSSVVLDTDGFSAEIVPSGYYNYMVNSGTGSGGSSSAIVEVTYVQAQTLITNSTLVAGSQYKITNKADAGIILLAVSTNQFSLEGQGIFLNPDFQNVYGSNVGVWHSGLVGLVLGTSVVIWDGLHYESVTGAVGTAPSGDVVTWVLVPKSAADYIEEVDFILYDFDNDSILLRSDKRENEINSSSLSVFQFGNNNVAGIKSNYNCEINIINQRGSFTGAIFLDGCTFNLDNTHEGNIYDNTFGGVNQITANLDTGIQIHGCTIKPILNITFNPTTSYTGKEITSLGSTFEATLDMTDGDDYNAATDTLTIPTDLNYVGIFNLVDCAAQPIVEIANLPSVGEVEFRVADAADTVVFTNTAIGGAVADNLVSDVVGNNTLTGRTNGNDFIRYRKSGTLNEMTLVFVAA